MSMTLTKRQREVLERVRDGIRTNGTCSVIGEVLEELERASLVERLTNYPYVRLNWRITDAGRRALEENKP